MQQLALNASDEKTKMPEEVMSDSIDNPTDEDSGIPVFNLAEQIMEEHRRSVTHRRQRSVVASSAPHKNSIKSVVQQYVHSADSAPIAVNRKSSIDHHPWIGQSLTPFQQEILEEIVRKDMDLCSHKYLSSAKCPSMNN